MCRTSTPNRGRCGRRGEARKGLFFLTAGRLLRPRLRRLALPPPPAAGSAPPWCLLLRWRLHLPRPSWGGRCDPPPPPAWLPRLRLRLRSGHKRYARQCGPLSGRARCLASLRLGLAPALGALLAAPPRRCRRGLRSALSGPRRARPSGAPPSPAASLRPWLRPWAARYRRASACCASPCGRLRAACLALAALRGRLCALVGRHGVRRGGSPSRRPAACGPPLRCACPRSSVAAAWRPGGRPGWRLAAAPSGVPPLAPPEGGKRTGHLLRCRPMTTWYGMPPAGWSAAVWKAVRPGQAESAADPADGIAYDKKLVQT